ncbi:MAG TPA: OmpA family protein [Xanthomonadaceae bacterium]|jgi:outer membrane protein OmpA-like peptidoglycan-associated protein|nr:OmpA family protein [Xanthomonadaceae bacterium]
MNRLPICATLVLAVLLSAQVSVAAAPPKDPDLERLSGQLAQLDADPSLGQLGAADRLKARQAFDALAQTMPRSNERPMALYIAERRVAAAQFAAQADLAEHQLDQLDRENDRILLEASRRDADQARQEAERLRLQNTARDEESQRAEAQRQAQAQQAAGIANDESEQARALAEARAKGAALAQQEAALKSGVVSPRSLPSTGTEPRGPSMNVPGSAFATGSGSLRGDAQTRALLKALVAFAKASPGATIQIEGHTDNQGNPQTNLALSQQRADAIKGVLRAAGIPASQIRAVGLGAEQPVASNSTAQGREHNRRIEVIVLRNVN